MGALPGAMAQPSRNPWANIPPTPPPKLALDSEH
jgi:hypothetical protein